jgi:hypothetical protein
MNTIDETRRGPANVAALILLATAVSASQAGDVTPDLWPTVELLTLQPAVTDVAILDKLIPLAAERMALIVPSQDPFWLEHDMLLLKLQLARALLQKEKQSACAALRAYASREQPWHIKHEFTYESRAVFEKKLQQLRQVTAAELLDALEGRVPSSSRIDALAHTVDTEIMKLDRKYGPCYLSDGFYYFVDDVKLSRLVSARLRQSKEDELAGWERAARSLRDSSMWLDYSRGVRDGFPEEDYTFAKMLDFEARAHIGGDSDDPEDSLGYLQTAWDMAEEPYDAKERIGSLAKKPPLVYRQFRLLHARARLAFAVAGRRPEKLKDAQRRLAEQRDWIKSQVDAMIGQNKDEVNSFVVTGKILAALAESWASSMGAADGRRKQ